MDCFTLCKDEISSLSRADHIVFRDRRGERLGKLLNQMAMKVFPEVACLDVRVHAREWGIHAWSLRGVNHTSLTYHTSQGAATYRSRTSGCAATYSATVSSASGWR